MKGLCLLLCFRIVVLGAALLLDPSWRTSAVPSSRRTAQHQAAGWVPSRTSSTNLFAAPQQQQTDKNSIYIDGLIENLSALLDKYILTGSPAARERVMNVVEQIATQCVDPEQLNQSLRMVKRAGVPLPKSFFERTSSSESELGKTDSPQRSQEAANRQQWEEQRTTTSVGSKVAGSVKTGRSALSRREQRNGKTDLMLDSVTNSDPAFLKSVAEDKKLLQEEMNGDASDEGPPEEPTISAKDTAATTKAATKVSQLLAKSGSGNQFDGDVLGIGGLEDVLAQVKRRVWIPLAAPPQLLADLGIHPVRGLLLYGKPGCGKTLIARTLGSLLSPMRPVTVVSGPEIMDKFVGSSEKNLREVFDNPPDIYDKYRIGERDGGEAIAGAALHVVVMDEFDAVARTRGGKGGKGDQGDAGVARDSVVNQLLAKLDGVHPLPVPTLVIGLTNKRSLIDPGRFEVQIEVPPPKTPAQRVSILKVHTKQMYQSGRMMVRDPPLNTVAAQQISSFSTVGDIPSYEELLEELAEKSEGYSGAALAGVTRAAASHALERAVTQLANQEDSIGPVDECLVTKEDFAKATEDVSSSMGTTDHAEEGEEDDATTASTNVDTITESTT